MDTTRHDLAAYPVLHDGSRSLALLGKGADGRPVVIKLLKRSPAASSDLERLANEHNLTKDLHLEGIRSSRALIQIEGSPALELAYVPGQTVREAFINRRRPLADILSAARSISMALDRLHRQGVIHRHISPDNILVAPDQPTATLIDFDLAARVDPKTGHAGVVAGLLGSPPYVSPEQTGRLDWPTDHRSDLYSLGAVLYEMLSGKPPFAGEDLAELLHFHIALTPFPLCRLDPAIPQAVSDMVMKLLKKNVASRYRSAYGLAADLKHCLDRLSEFGKVEPFALGQDDLSGIFVMPAALFGRDRELMAGRRAYELAEKGAGGVLFVCGEAGAGKTALVEEMCSAARRKGLVIAGKYDEYERNTPYQGLIQALSNLVDRMLADPPERLSQLKAALVLELGTNVSLLVEAIPGLGQVIDKFPPLPDLGPKESQHRFRHAILGLLRSASNEGRFRILFLDNLQWADPASLQLLSLLAAEARNSSVLLIGAYRESEAGPGRPLADLFEELKRQKIRISLVRLENLAPEALCDMVADTLGCRHEQARPLAEMIHAKTGGNPYFSIHFFRSLYEEGVLAFDYDQRRWSWNLDVIDRMDITNNIAALMAKKVGMLPKETREALSMAACVGNAFSVEMLAALIGQDIPATLELLRVAMDMGVLRLVETAGQSLSGNSGRQPRSVCFEFPHDRVRNACYTILPKKSRRAIHLMIGRMLLGKTTEAELENRVYEITEQLNEGFMLIGAEQEKVRLAELNLIAGRKAKREAAHFAAIRRMSMGIGLLPQDKWERFYNLTLSLFMEAIEAEYLSSNFDRADLLSLEVLRRARDIPTRIKVYELRVLFYSAQKQNAEAIKAGIEALRFLDISLPVDPGELAGHVETLKRELTERVHRIDDLAHLPIMSDPQQLAEMRLLAQLATPASQTDPTLLFAIILRMVLMSLDHGNSAMAALAYGWFAALLCGPERDIEKGYRFGRLSLQVQKQRPAAEFEAIPPLLFNVFVRHWKEHASATVPALESVHKRGLEAGDLDSAYSAAVYACIHLLCVGAPLPGVRDKLEELLGTTERFRLDFPAGLAKIWGRATLKLQEGVVDPCRLGGEIIDEAQLLPLWMDSNEQALLFSAYCCRTMLQSLLGDYEGAIESARLGEEYEAGQEGHLFAADAWFHHALALLVSCRGVDADCRQERLDKVAQLHARLQELARHAPMNFRHKCDIIEAERAWVEGDSLKAMDGFGRAISGARENGYAHMEALAYEREAEFHLDRDRPDLAGLCIRNAVDGYRLWGANHKATELESRHRSLLAKEDSLALDTAAILEASRMISQELHLEKLLERMMRIVMASAGAEKGILIENQNGRLFIQAKYLITQDAVETLLRTPLESSAEVPMSVVSYVTRTLEPLVLRNASAAASAFAGDEYIAENSVKSLLCLPILLQTRLSGILYLENNQAGNIFTASRLEILRALSSQAAISIRNAVLFEDLEATISELEQAREGLAERIRIEEALSACAGALLVSVEDPLNEALRHLLVAANASRAYLFENFEDPELGMCIRQTHEACAEGVFPEIDNPLLQRLPYADGFGRWRDALSSGEPITGLVENFPQCERDILEPQNILSILVLPVQVGGRWHGLIGFDDVSQRREWDAQGVRLLATGASIIGSYLAQKSANEAVRESRERYQGLFEASPISLWEEDFSEVKVFLDSLRQAGVTDYRDHFAANPKDVSHCAELVKILDVNASTVELFKAESKEALLAGLPRILTATSQDIFREELIALADGAQSFQAEADQRNFANEILNVVLRLSVVQGCEGDLRRVLVSLTDITQRKKAEEALVALNRTLETLIDERTRTLQVRSKELEDAYGLLKQADKLKTELVSTVSHDVRTPLTSILGFASLIQKDFSRTIIPRLNGKNSDLAKKAERINANLEIIVSEAQRLARLINDFLDLSKIEAGRLEWRDCEVTAAEIVSHAVNAVSGEFLAKPDVKLEFEVAEDLPLLRVDSDRMVQVLVNLLNNAAKFTNEGRVTIKVMRPSPTAIRFIIQDTGIGIPDDELERIFDRFHKVEHEDLPWAATKGSGLGLSICKEIVGHYHGKIWVESELNQGSVFSVELPSPG